MKCWDPYGKREKGTENTLVRRNFHQLICVCIHFRCPRVLSSPFEQKTKVEHWSLLRFWTVRLLLPIWLRLFVRGGFLCWSFGFYKKRQGGTISQTGDLTPIKGQKNALFSLSKSLLRVASSVKAPWTQREQSPRSGRTQEPAGAGASSPSGVWPRACTPGKLQEGFLRGVKFGVKPPACRYLMCRRAGVLQVHAPAHPALTCSRCSHLDTALAGDSCRLSPGKSLFSLDTDGVTDMFGSSEPAKKGRGEQRGRAGCQHPRLVASWPKDLCVWWSPWWSPRYFTPPVSRVSKTLTLSTREPPPGPRKLPLSRIPIPRRAELSVSISMLGIRVYLMTNFTYSLMEK